MNLNHRASEPLGELSIRGEEGQNAAKRPKTEVGPLRLLRVHRRPKSSPAAGSVKDSVPASVEAGSDDSEDLL